MAFIFFIASIAKRVSVCVIVKWIFLFSCDEGYVRQCIITISNDDVARMFDRLYFGINITQWTSTKSEKSAICQGCKMSLIYQYCTQIKSEISKGSFLEFMLVAFAFKEIDSAIVHWNVTTATVDALVIIKFKCLEQTNISKWLRKRFLYHLLNFSWLFSLWHTPLNLLNS